MCLRLLRGVRECGAHEMCFLVDAWLRAHELAHRTSLFARVCSRELKGSRVSRVLAHICARACARVFVFARVKRTRDPARKPFARKGVRVPENRKFTSIIYICILY